MKRFFLLTILSVIFLVSCKKDAVDGESTKAFQESINDMTSSLPTLQQIKFNEALYILKTFGVEADGDLEELKALAKLLDGKKVPEIFAMADQVAKQNGITWASNAPPSLGEMNIFQNITPSEKDPNDILAASIQINVNPVSVDSILGPKAIMVVPRLLDNNGTRVEFDKAALETILVISSQGEKIMTSKNLMQNNSFKGFYVTLASLPKDKIFDDKIDVKITVKTSKKILEMTKMGVPINGKALLTPEVTTDEVEITDPNAVTPDGATTEVPKVMGDPKNTVVNFLSSLNSQNLKAAYSQADNPSWGSYETFSNPNSGFGTVKKVDVKTVDTKNNANNAASVNATYIVTDKNGNTTELDVSYGLKATENGWKITSYKINSSQKK